MNFKTIMRKFNLTGVHSHNKSIPEDWLYTDTECRLHLLRGLIDSDGSVVVDESGKGHHIEYSTTSEILAKQVTHLVRSFGGRCSTSSRMGKYKKDGVVKETRTNYRLIISMPTGIIPFTSVKHSKKYRDSRQRNHRYITKITKESTREMCQCIKVASKDNLYVTKDYILTHNTTVGMQLTNGLAQGFNGKALFASLEMPTTSLFIRSAVIELNRNREVPLTYDEVVNTVTTDPNIVNDVSGKWDSMLLIDKTSVDLEQIKKYYELANEKCGFSLTALLIDYVGLISNTSSYEELSKVARGLKRLAKELNTRVICVVQLSRKGGDGNIPVTVDMLRDSGALEESADYILGMWISRGAPQTIHCSFIKNRFGERNQMFNIRNNGLCYTTEDYVESAECPTEEPKNEWN